MKTYLQTIREKVIEANPEILELKFGCEVDRGGDSESKEVIAGFFNDTIALVRRHPEVGDFLPFEVPKELVGSWKILGRPIRLADVLLAINMRGEVWDKYHVSTTGHFYKVLLSGEISQPEKWDSKSPQINSLSYLRKLPYSVKINKI